MDEETRVVVVDDHKMIAKAIMDMVNGFSQCAVLYAVHDWADLLREFRAPKNIPDLVLLDISMPGMDGYKTMERLHKDHPEVRVLCLSMKDEEDVFLRMVELGVHGFVPKVAGSEELERAIRGVMAKGFYFTPNMAEALFRAHHAGAGARAGLSDREKELLSYVGTEMTYVQIADKMCLSPKTVDGYRNSLFEKLNVRSRIGLAMYAVRNGYHEP
jgi:DNA-binding NarL/FixJ family response regulator